MVYVHTYVGTVEAQKFPRPLRMSCMLLCCDSVFVGAHVGRSGKHALCTATQVCKGVYVCMCVCMHVYLCIHQ